MSRLICSISVSLDGYVAGPDPGTDQGLGAGGEALHEWIYDLASWREMHGKEAAGGKNVSVGGGGGCDPAVSARGLLDELLLSVVPVLLGGGMRLLEGLGDAPGELARAWIGESPSGVTHLRYRVVR